MLSNFSPVGPRFLAESEDTELELDVTNSSTSNNHEGSLNMCRAGRIQDYKAEVRSWRAHVPINACKPKLKK